MKRFSAVMTTSSIMLSMFAIYFLVVGTLSEKYEFAAGYYLSPVLSFRLGLFLFLVGMLLQLIVTVIDFVIACLNE